MKANKIPRAFRSHPGTLPRVALRLLGALNDPAIGPPVAANLPATFVADFTAQIAAVEKHGNDQSGAFGNLHTLTRAQAAARAEVFRLAVLARRAGRHAFPGQDPLLHSEFQVGVHAPVDLASVLERSRRLLAACVKYPDELAANGGWPPTNTTALSTAIDALAGADQSQKTAADTKQGITAQRITSANTLYKNCLLVQNAARMAYTGASVDGDPAALEARARYLLGEFPARPNAPAISAVPAAVSPTALAVVPTPAPVAPTAPPLAA